MKSLKPAMRENKRYLFVDGENLKVNIEKAILDFMGFFGMSKVGLDFIKTNNNSAIISINREMVDSVRAAICVAPSKMEVKKVSGTIKGLGKI